MLSGNLNENEIHNLEIPENQHNSTLFPEKNQESDLGKIIPKHEKSDVDSFGTQVRTPANITRKISLQYDKSKHNALTHVFKSFCKLKNDITSQIWERIDPADFRKKGNFYADAYAKYQIKTMRAPRGTYQFKERIYQSAFAAIYFSIRNCLLREGNLNQILHRLSDWWSGPNMTGQEWITYLNKAKLENSIIVSLKNALSQDLWGNEQKVSNYYLQNYLVLTANSLE
jgi:hypothetical protein